MKRCAEVAVLRLAAKSLMRCLDLVASMLELHHEPHLDININDVFVVEAGGFLSIDHMGQEPTMGSMECHSFGKHVAV